LLRPQLDARLLVDEVFGLHGFDLAVPFYDNSETVLFVAEQGLANASINGWPTTRRFSRKMRSTSF